MSRRPTADSRVAPPARRTASRWPSGSALAVIAAGLMIGFGLAKWRPQKRRNAWHSVSAPSDYDSRTADTVRRVLTEAGLTEEVIDTIACGSWATDDVPIISTPEQYHAYGAAVAGLEQLHAGAVGVIGAAASQIAAALIERMDEWETGQTTMLRGEPRISRN